MELFVMCMLLILSAAAPVLWLGLFTYYWFIRKEIRGFLTCAVFLAWYFWIGKEGPGTALFTATGPRMIWTFWLAVLPALVPLESYLTGRRRQDVKLQRGGLLGFCFAVWSALWGATIVIHWAYRAINY